MDKLDISWGDMLLFGFVAVVVLTTTLFVEQKNNAPSTDREITEFKAEDPNSRYDFSGRRDRPDDIGN